MLKRLKKVSLGISMAAAIAVSPVALQAGAMEGLTESTSGYLEAPNFEHQLVRINTGINFIRLSNDIMKQMPISGDAEWVDKTVVDMNMDIIKATMALDEVKNDAYFSTAPITNLILRRPVISMSPAIIRLYYVSSVMYKNKANSYVLDADGQQIMGKNGKPKQNGYQNFHIPDFNEFPDITNLETYSKFKDDPKVSLIDVEAKNENLYPNLQSAVLALLPDDVQDSAKLALEEKEVALENFKETKENIAKLEKWIDNENHANDPEMGNKKNALAIAEEKNKVAEEAFDNKKDIYLSILEQGALKIETNFDETKVPLAIKVDKLLELVDDGAINAASLFVVAGYGIMKGIGEFDKELAAIAVAKGLTTLVGNQKQFLIERYKRMGVGALMAVPNVALGAYYIVAARGTISTYKDVVGAVIDGAELQEEAKIEAAKATEAQEQAEAPSTETK